MNSSFVPDLILRPEDHPSLTENSIVSKNLKVEKNFNGNKLSVYPTELIETNDRVTPEEFKKIKNAIINDKLHKKTRKNTLKKWKNHFKK